MLPYLVKSSKYIFISPEPNNKDIIVTAKNADITNFEIVFLESLGFFFLRIKYTGNMNNVRRIVPPIIIIKNNSTNTITYPYLTLATRNLSSPQLPICCFNYTSTSTEYLPFSKEFPEPFLELKYIRILYCISSRFFSSILQLLYRNKIPFILGTLFIFLSMIRFTSLSQGLFIFFFCNRISV